MKFDLARVSSFVTIGLIFLLFFVPTPWPHYPVLSLFVLFLICLSSLVAVIIGRRTNKRKLFLVIFISVFLSFLLILLVVLGLVLLPFTGF